MDKRQLRNLGLILVLPIIFAGLGYFGMKVFLSGSGPKTVNPESRPAVEENANSNDSGSGSIVTGSKTDSKSQAGSSGDSVSGTDTEGQTSGSAQNSSGSKTDEGSAVAQPENKPEDKSSTVEEKSTETAEKKESYTFPSVNFFSLQVGSYSARSNADKHVESLGQEGIRAYVFEGNNYKVMAGVSGTRDGVDTIKSQLADTIPDAFVKGLVIVPDTLKYDASAKEDLGAFTSIVNDYKNRLDSNVAFASSIDSRSADDVKAYLQTDAEKIDGIKAKIDAYKGDASFKAVLDKMKTSLNSSGEKVRQLINKENASNELFSYYIKELLNFNKIS